MTEYIATYNLTDGNYDYNGPDTAEAIIESVKRDIRDNYDGVFSWEGQDGSPALIQSVYILPVDDAHPCGDSDADPIWAWAADIQCERCFLATDHKGKNTCQCPPEDITEDKWLQELSQLPR